MDHYFPERELGDSGTFFQDARGSSDSESEDYDDSVIEDADTEAVAPVVLAAPKSRFPAAQPDPSPPSEAENPPITQNPPNEVNPQSPLNCDIAEKPNYPSLDEPSASSEESSSSEEKPASSGWFSWIGSLFGSSAPASASKPSSPSPDPNSAHVDESSSLNNAKSITEAKKQEQPVKQQGMSSQGPQQTNSTNSSAPSSSNSTTSQPQQPQTINYIIINGHHGGVTALPPEVQQLVETLGRSQYLPAPYLAPGSSAAAPPLPPPIPTAMGPTGGPPPPPLPPSDNAGFGGPPPPPTPPKSLASPSSSEFSNEDRIGESKTPQSTNYVPSSSSTPSLVTVTAEERRARQKAAREAERANQVKQSWVETLRQIVEVCDRLPPNAKQEAIQYWISWYDANIAYANLLTTYYYPLLQNIPKQYELIQNALNFWEKSLFEQLGSELNIDTAAVNELRKRRSVNLCDSEIKWFRSKDKTQDSINDERSKLLEASFTFCSSAIRQERQRLDQNKLQDELADRLSKIRAKTSEVEEPVEMDE
jgi:hypothetical protein